MTDPIIPPKRGEDLTPGGRGTIRLHEYFEKISAATNSNTVVAESGSTFNSALSRINNLENRLGSGDALTWDETGFTWDSDKLSFDMDEA